MRTLKQIGGKLKEELHPQDIYSNGNRPWKNLVEKVEKLIKK